MSAKKSSNSPEPDYPAAWARAARRYSGTTFFRDQMRVVIAELEQKYLSEIGPVGLAGVVVQSGLWELLDQFVPKGARCSIWSQNTMAMGSIEALLVVDYDLAVAAGMIPLGTELRITLTPHLYRWRQVWHVLYGEAQDAVERGTASSRQALIVDLGRQAVGSCLGGDAGGAKSMISALWPNRAKRLLSKEDRKECMDELSTLFYLTLKEDPAGLANTLYRRKDGTFSFGGRGLRDVTRSRDRSKRPHATNIDEVNEPVDLTTQGPDEAAMAAEEVQQASDLVRRLDEYRKRQQSTLDASLVRRLVAEYARALLEGRLSARELAEQTGWSRQAIDAELARIREMLREPPGPNGG